MTTARRTTASAALTGRGGRGRAVEAGSTVRFGPVSRLGLGAAVLWTSLLVLLPLAAVVVASAGTGWSGFWDSITGPAASSALRFTIASSLLVCAGSWLAGAAPGPRP